MGKKSKNPNAVQMEAQRKPNKRGTLRDRWYGNIEQELNRTAAVMLAEGKISKATHDEIVAENSRQRTK